MAIFDVINLAMYILFFIASLLLAIPSGYKAERDDFHIAILVFLAYVLIIIGFARFLNEITF